MPDGAVSLRLLGGAFHNCFQSITCLEVSQAGTRPAKISGSSSRNSSGLISIPYQSLDLTPGSGNLLGEFYWEILSPWRGAVSMLNSGACPREERESCLWQILEEHPHPKYYLTRKACLGILRRASERGKALPPALQTALEIQAGLRSGTEDPLAINVSGALMATQNMQMQTCVTQPKDSARSPVLCLNDQGGQIMDCTENITGTLRAQMHSHQPLVYENHGIAARYTGPHSVAPTLTARCGTGGNNVPLVGDSPTVYCIAGNTIDREPGNGGNGLGCQENIAYCVTTCDHHAVYSRQRVDVFRENTVVSTESARQYKDATDLVVQPRQQENTNLIRRLTPLEAERLMGYPTGWTDIPSASDSARYKALGNSVVIPCVEFVMHGIALVLRESRRRRGWRVIIFLPWVRRPGLLTGTSHLFFYE